MKSKLINKKIFNLIIITILLLTTKVFAANDKFGTTLSVNNLQVKREDNVIITIGLKDIDIESGEEGIAGYTATVKFDPTVLEYVSTDGTDKWEAPFYQGGLITGNTGDGEVIKTTQNIGTITFKVKKDAKLGKTKIELTNFSGSTVENDVYANRDESVEITIVDSNNNNGGNNDSNNNNNNNGNNNNNSNNNGNNNNNSNNNTNKVGGSITEIDEATDGKIPQTGEGNIILIACIGVAIICSVISYIKMNK